MNTIIQTLAALMTPLIAMIAVYIAYQQYRINEQTEKRESKASRLSVYSRFKKFFNEVSWTNMISSETYEAFNDAVAEADFLFPKDVTSWLLEIQGWAAEWFNQKKGIEKYVGEKIRTKHELLKLKEGSPTFTPAIDLMEECIEHILEAHGELQGRFEKYLDGT